MHDFLQYRFDQTKKKQDFITKFLKSYFKDFLKGEDEQTAFFKKIRKNDNKDIPPFDQFVESLRKTLDQREQNKKELIEKFEKTSLKKFNSQFEKSEQIKIIKNLLKEIESNKNDLFDKLEKSRTLHGKFVKNFNKSIAENKKAKFSEYDCFTGCKSLSETVRKVRLLCIQYAKDIVGLYDTMKKWEYSSSLEFTSIFNDFQIFVKQNSSMEFQFFENAMKILQMVIKKFLRILIKKGVIRFQHSKRYLQNRKDIDP